MFIKQPTIVGFTKKEVFYVVSSSLCAIMTRLDDDKFKVEIDNLEPEYYTTFEEADERIKTSLKRGFKKIGVELLFQERHCEELSDIKLRSLTRDLIEDAQEETGRNIYVKIFPTWIKEKCFNVYLDKENLFTGTEEECINFIYGFISGYNKKDCK